MAKFGKKNVVSDDLSNYNIVVIGEPGVGKTTLMYNTCYKLFGDDGYIIFNMGKEDGISCIDGAVYEDIENWKKFEEVTNDIIKNKKTDYPDLKVIILDTIDQCMDLAEPKVIDMWNKDNIGKKDFVPAKTLNASYGGFGRGEEAVIKLVLDKIWALKAVGVAVWMCGHTKSREIVDPLTNQTYTSLTTNMMQKYFNGIKSKMHLVGVACIDRDIVTEGTGRKNVVTKKEITKNKVVSESRKIVFRDDNYSVDSKSRFANIEPEIPLDADAFIKALKDAIASAKTNTTSTAEQNKKTTKKVAEEIKEIEEDIEIEDVVEDVKEEEIPFDEDVDTEEVDKDALVIENRKLFKECKDRETKIKVRDIIKDNGGSLENLDVDVLIEINNILS